MSSNWDMPSQHTPIHDDEPVAAMLTPPVLSVAEAERYVEELRQFSIEEVGTDKWMEQHERIEKLNIQAHHCAMSNTDEFVLEAILTFDKLKTLIHDLIITEAWVDLVFPHLLSEVAGKNSMRTYFIFYHQASLINLLEVLFYHKHVCEAGGDMMLEMVDYCARKYMRLNGGYDFSKFDPINEHSAGRPTASAAASVEESSARTKEFLDALKNKTPADDLMGQLSQTEFSVCIAAVSIGRFICEHCDSMPLSVATRIADTHDFLILILPLIENPPWTRRVPNNGPGGGMKWQKLIDNKWTDVAPIDLLKVSKLEGQPWLMVFCLLSKTVFRERYLINTFRKAQLLRVRKFINDVLLDQLPVMADIQRYMDQLAMAEVSDGSSTDGGPGSVFKFQQVAVYRETLLRNRDWKKIAKDQLAQVFTMTDATDRYLKRMADLYCDEGVEGVLDPPSMAEVAYAASKAGVSASATATAPAGASSSAAAASAAPAPGVVEISDDMAGCFVSDEAPAAGESAVVTEFESLD